MHILMQNLFIAQVQKKQQYSVSLHTAHSWSLVALSCIHTSYIYALHTHALPLTKNEITFGPISILFCTKSLLKA